MLTYALSQGPLMHVLGALRLLPFVPRIVTEFAVHGLANATGARPRPFSLASDYTSWVSLTDRTFSGRHLQATDPTVVPTEEQVRELFRRPPSGEKVSTDTSVLFMLFAQWFTDSFLRTERSDWRKNTSTQEIDFCQIYGLTEAQTRLLRKGKGGLLKSQQIRDEEYPPYLFRRTADGEYKIKAEFTNLHNEQFLTQILLKGVPDQQKDVFFAVGLEHGNSTVGSTALDVLFLREHNRIAALLAEQYRQGRLEDWPPMSEAELDERLFQTTRNTMIVLLIKLVVEEYIRHITPFDLPIKFVPKIAEGRRWNRSNRVAIEFNLLYRWHSLVPEKVMTDEGEFDAKEFLRDNNQLVLSKGIGWLMDQASRSRAAKVGLLNTPTFLIDKDPDLGYPGIEERTIALMRKARLQPFNAYRRQFNLPTLKSFDALTSDPVVKKRLRDLYDNDIDKVEWYVGIFAEDYPDNHLFGSLMTTMVGHDAFTQALTNPLLADDVYTEKTFTGVGLAIIEETASLRQILARNTKLPADAAVSFKYTPRRRGGTAVPSKGRRSETTGSLQATSADTRPLSDAR
ncbi:prostaglandin-endoperoxide synthase 2 [Geodermatophilus amargosae]|uniref:Prostaglandin-endoperoxide synthase 2 n=1 Tax=Geodermatophilus amargosae TaxID=1296565 RepID=A0A1I7D6A7_9ACTN|nr:prostaglandin-endoperoxide synthase 2 [Geodermatophilus amargosae]